MLSEDFEVVAELTVVGFLMVDVLGFGGMVGATVAALGLSLSVLVGFEDVVTDVWPEEESSGNRSSDSVSSDCSGEVEETVLKSAEESSEVAAKESFDLRWRTESLPCGEPLTSCEDEPTEVTGRRCFFSFFG